ncbi:putative ABC transport system ATP-binding protein [Alkalispirillum mobile]|uniref:Putative ABC transport system ATP-binding protein n=1 Tax=Alkalispirillum mobile TaxID=85925 RepID=A0A498CCP9_9GAMM|nr:ATP-binding cassette domain-containing protein [Alkalispirillum mobile]RLK50168.1 putative ABC transport system ATP-binding protein [Alkalispirillum mobile]
MLQIKDLAYRYRDGQPLHFPDWRAEAGEHWWLSGPSGTGKTTLLHLLAGLLSPSSGAVRVNEQTITDFPSAARDRFRGRHIGLVFQRLHLLPALTVAANLELARYLAGLPRDHARIEQVLERLGLADLAGRRAHQLSQGQAQRVAIARAVVNRPSILLADEPTASLDDENARRVAELLCEQAAACRATLVVASHDTRLARWLPHRLDLAEGRVAA